MWANAGNCSIGYSLPPRQLPWTKNFLSIWLNIYLKMILRQMQKGTFLVQGNWRGGRLYHYTTIPCIRVNAATYSNRENVSISVKHCTYEQKYCKF